MYEAAEAAEWERGPQWKHWSEERTTVRISFVGQQRAESRGLWEANRDTIALIAVAVLAEIFHTKP